MVKYGETVVVAPTCRKNMPDMWEWAKPIFTTWSSLPRWFFNVFLLLHSFYNFLVPPFALTKKGSPASEILPLQKAEPKKHRRAVRSTFFWYKRVLSLPLQDTKVIKSKICMQANTKLDQSSSLCVSHMIMLKIPCTHMMRRSMQSSTANGSSTYRYLQ